MRQAKNESHSFKSRNNVVRSFSLALQLKMTFHYYECAQLSAPRSTAATLCVPTAVARELIMK
jgi:hypothetical protein